MRLVVGGPYEQAKATTSPATAPHRHRPSGQSRFLTAFLSCPQVFGDRLFSRYARQQLVAVDFVPRLVCD